MATPNDKTVVTQKGLGMWSFLCLGLTFIFVTAKIFHQIEWSWVWVLSPIWIYAIFFGIYVFFWLLLAGLIAWVKS